MYVKPYRTANNRKTYRIRLRLLGFDEAGAVP